MDASEIKIGLPVNILYDGIIKDKSWVGYVRRINYRDKLAEIGPETVVGSHLRVYEFGRLVKSEFTENKHPKLDAEILMLQTLKFDETGKVIH